jgi:arylsulfatase A-like enzyme
MTRFPLLAESMKADGLATGAILASGILKSKRGLSKDFDFYEDNFEAKRYKDSKKDRKSYRKTADEVVDIAMDWIRNQDPAEPFFLFMHFFDAHHSYDLTPDKYMKMFKTDPELVKILETRNQNPKHKLKINKYDASIRYLDEELSRFREFLELAGIYDNCLIIITADHGEGLGEHGWFYHGLYVYEEQMHVPLIIRFPQGVHAGKRIEALVDLVDITPTILDFSELPPIKDARGKSLLPLVKGEVNSIRDYEYFERRWYKKKNRRGGKNWAQGEKFGVRGDRWKYIWASNEPEELYDLEADPHELKNIAPAHPEEVSTLKEEMEKYWVLVDKGEIKPQKLDKETRKELKALGYLR